MSVKGLDSREMSSRQPPMARGVDLGLKISKIRRTICIWRRVILLPLGSHKIFIASLVDLFLVDCIVFHQHSSTYSTGKFHDIHSTPRCLWQFYVCRLYCEKYSGGCGSYDYSIFNRVFNVFLPIKTTHFIVYFSKGYDVVLVVDPVFH